MIILGLTEQAIEDHIASLQVNLSEEQMLRLELSTQTEVLAMTEELAQTAEKALSTRVIAEAARQFRDALLPSSPVSAIA